MAKTYTTDCIPDLLIAFYEATAAANGWRFSYAHDGWINDNYQDNADEGADGYEVHPTASDVCFCCDLLERELEALLRPIEHNLKAIAAISISAGSAK